MRAGAVVNVLGWIGIDGKWNGGNSWKGLSQVSGGFSSRALCEIVRWFGKKAGFLVIVCPLHFGLDRHCAATYLITVESCYYTLLFLTLTVVIWNEFVV